MSPRVCVLGGGVNGLWSAIRLLEGGFDDVTVVSKSWTPFTTSNVAVAVWEPFLVGPEQDQDLLNRWGEATWRKLVTLRRELGERESGVQFISGFWLSRTTLPIPPWHKVVLNFHKLTQQQILDAGFDTSVYKDAAFLTTLLIDMSRFMQWTMERVRELGGKDAAFLTTLLIDMSHFMQWTISMERVRELGGKLETRTVDSLHELATDCDLVVNCSGLGSHSLKGVEDKSMYPIRGQLALVKHSQMRHFVWDEEVYMFPRKNALLLGGTYQQGNWSLESSKEDEGTILTRCARIIPDIKDCQYLGPRVGLRPGRPSVRLETEIIDFSPDDDRRSPVLSKDDRRTPVLSKDDRRSPSLPGHRQVCVIHNYGHGGAGITLHYGCANDVLKLARQHFGTRIEVSSKL